MSVTPSPLTRNPAPFRDFRRRFAGHRLGVVSMVAILIILGMCLAAPVFEHVFGRLATDQNLFNRLADPGPNYWLGTDALGRDTFLRLLYGGQISLIVGLATTLLTALIGTAAGLVAGYFGGWIDRVLMRIVDTVIALPALPLLIVLAAADLTKIGVPEAAARSETAALYQIVVIIALVGWTTIARLVRASTLSVRARTYVTAAKGMGLSDTRIILRHILPNVAAPLVVASTLTIGNVILLESVLSFLGLGIQPPIPSWGNMLTNAQDLIWNAPLQAVFPGLAILIVVMAFNLAGDALQQALDPKSDDAGFLRRA